MPTKFPAESPLRHDSQGDRREEGVAPCGSLGPTWPPPRSSTGDPLKAGLRLGGIFWPGRIRSGRCWSPSLGWSFWFTRRAELVLLLTLEATRRVVPEPAALAATLSPPP